MANLSLKHIYKVYPNGAKAVNDFNMTIADKEFIVFVGPSGCGKSTTLRMIAGLEAITAGELKIGDEVVNDVPPQDRDIAMVFQNYALYPHMTVYDNIAFGLQMRKIPKGEIDKRVQEAAKILEITDYLKKKPKEMSGGQRQRVALGRAIVRNPKVMLLDEPLSNLDAKLRTQMRSEITKLHVKLNTTFIYVTHDQVEAMTMGTRIVVMKDGFIQQIDTPRNLYSYPENKFVAGFIGTPQMNFFEGTLKKVGEQVEIVFANCDAKITVPYSYFYKARPSYLNGETSVYIGLRAEDLSLDPGAVKNAIATIKVKVSHTEQLGNEALVYGDINMEGDGFTESNTRVIIKGKEDIEVVADEIVEAALNLNRLHLFDKETEKSILPRIPDYNYLDCQVQGNQLSFLGQTIMLPPAMAGAEGANELLIPTDAITLGGDISVKVVDTEMIGDRRLLALELAGHRLFAVVDHEVSEDTVGISIDMKRVTLRKDSAEIITPMPLLIRFDGSFKKVTVDEDVQTKSGKTKKKKVLRYRLAIEDAEFDSPEEIRWKLVGALTAKVAFSTKFTYESTPYQVTLGKSGITANVIGTRDYGTEKFAECKVGEKTVFVKVDAPVSGEVKLSPNADTLSIVQTDTDIRVV